MSFPDLGTRTVTYRHSHSVRRREPSIDWRWLERRRGYSPRFSTSARVRPSRFASSHSSSREWLSVLHPDALCERNRDDYSFRYHYSRELHCPPPYTPTALTDMPLGMHSWPSCPTEYLHGLDAIHRLNCSVSAFEVEAVRCETRRSCRWQKGGFEVTHVIHQHHGL